MTRIPCRRGALYRVRREEEGPGDHHPGLIIHHRAGFADLSDGPLAHLPSGHFPANTAGLTCAAICHNLTPAAGTLGGPFHAKARGATIRRQLSGLRTAGTAYQAAIDDIIRDAGLDA